MRVLAPQDVLDGVSQEIRVDGASAEMQQVAPHRYVLRHQQHEYVLETPKREVHGLRGVSALAVNGVNSEIAVGTAAGDVVVKADPDVVVRGAHLSEVTSLEYFPSGKVLLSSGLDYTIRVLDASNGDNPRTFTGHRARITGLAVIGRGRNFASCSLDGTVRLWDCGSGENYAVLRKHDSVRDGFTAVCVTAAAGPEPEPHQHEPEPHQHEHGTGGKLLLAGLESGVVAQYDLRTKAELGAFRSLGSAVVALAADHQPHGHRLYVGYENGLLAEWDLHDTAKPVRQARFAHSIQSLALQPGSVVLTHDNEYATRVSLHDFAASYLVGFAATSTVGQARANSANTYIATECAIYMF